MTLIDLGLDVGDAFCEDVFESGWVEAVGTVGHEENVLCPGYGVAEELNGSVPVLQELADVHHSREALHTWSSRLGWH